MLENSKISLRNAIAAVIFIGGMVYGYAVIVGGIHNRLAVLESSNREKEHSLERIESKLDRLIERGDK